MKRHMFSKEDKKLILNLYKSGNPLKIISKKICMDYRTIKKFLIKSRISIRPSSAYQHRKRGPRREFQFKLGYKFIYKPGHPNSNKSGFIQEHRWIMSESVKRPLNEKEIVHHINGNKADNRLDNLVLTNRSSHVSEHHHEVQDMIKKLEKRRCIKCKEIKIASSFSKTGKKPFLNSRCRDCVKSFREKRNNGLKCSVLNCQRKQECKKLCNAHYKRSLRGSFGNHPIRRLPWLSKH